MRPCIRIAVLIFCVLGNLIALPALAQNGGFHINFGLVPIHQKKDSPMGCRFTSNSGITPYGCRRGMKIGTLKISGPDKADFTIVEDGISGKTCVPFTYLSATIRFTPSRLGPESAQLTAEVHAVDPGCEGQYSFAPCQLVGGGEKPLSSVKVEPANKPDDCPLELYKRGTNFFGKPVWADKDFFPSLDAINKAAGEASVKVLITNSFRLAGQKVNGTIVPPATLSNHLVGHAIDMNVLYVNAKGHAQLVSGPLGNNILSQAKLPIPVAQFIRLVKAAGLRWGGDFAKRDVVHFDDWYNKDKTQWQNKYDIVQKCALDSGFKP